MQREFVRPTMLAVLVAVLVAVLAFAPAALAAGVEITGKVQSVDTQAGTVTLEDGTMLHVDDTAKLADISEGDTVKASYEEREGQKRVTEIEKE
jgi:Cu/Ag efflux protein CusF